jgi:hypothetical protein
MAKIDNPPSVNRVPRLWPGSTIVCIGLGPSLTAEDVELCRGRARVIAIKTAIELAPWADVLYSGEIRWWKHYGPSLTFQGLRYGIEPAASPWATVLKNTGFSGLEREPFGLRTGLNSGYQAINLAVHLGAARIVLLGYDMQDDGTRRHFFGQHPWASSSLLARFKPMFDGIVQPLKDAGVEILNASRRTALTCFPRMPIEDALREAVAA